MSSVRHHLVEVCIIITSINRSSGQEKSSPRISIITRASLPLLIEGQLKRISIPRSSSIPTLTKGECTKFSAHFRTTTKSCKNGGETSGFQANSFFKLTTRDAGTVIVSRQKTASTFRHGLSSNLVSGFGQRCHFKKNSRIFS